MSDQCIFCRIVEGKALASVVFDNRSILAFMDKRPVNEGHILVIPKKHCKDLSELQGDNAGEMFKAAVRISSALRKSDIRTEGINLVLADGKAAGQEIFHVHLHIIPRYAGDHLILSSKKRLRPTIQELDLIAEKVNKEMEDQFSNSVNIP